MAPDEKDIWGRWAAPGERPSANPRAFTVSDLASTPRDSTRVPLAHRIQLKFDRFSGFIDEYVSNISPGGIFIRTESPEEPGQLLEFEFRLGDGFELIRGRGEVVWSRSAAAGGDRPKGMGVRFLELSPGSKDLIYKIVDDFVASGGKPFDLGTSLADEAPPASDPAADSTLPITISAALAQSPPSPAGAAAARLVSPTPGLPPRRDTSLGDLGGAAARSLGPSPARGGSRDDRAAGPRPPTGSTPVRDASLGDLGLPAATAATAASSAPTVPTVVSVTPYPAPPRGRDAALGDLGLPVSGVPKAPPRAAAPTAAAPPTAAPPAAAAAPPAGISAPPPLPESTAPLWPVDLPAIRQVPGVPAITPRSPLERLGPQDGAAASRPPAPPPPVPSPAFQPEPITPVAAVAPRSGPPPAAGGGGRDAAGSPAIDPLDQVLASLPPLDDLEPPSPPRPGGVAGLAAAATSAATPPPLPFSSFDLRSPRRRSRLPLIGALIAVAALGLGVYLLRDTVLAWIAKGEAPARVATSPADTGVRALPIGPGRRRRGALGAPDVTNGGAASSPPSPSPAPAAAGTPPGARAFGAAGAPAVKPGPATGSAHPTKGTSGQSAPALPSPHPSSPPPAALPPTTTHPAANTPPPAASGAGPAPPSPPALVSPRPGPVGAAATTSKSAAAAAPVTAGGTPVVPGGAPLTALERITWESARGGTDVVLRGNGEFPSQSYQISHMIGTGGLPPRELVRLLGIKRPFNQVRLTVSTAELAQIRTGVHPHDELHVVLDLAAAGVRVTGVEAGPHQLRIHLAAQ